jgi:branched-chain amino acid aminotransferase
MTEFLGWQNGQFRPVTELTVSLSDAGCVSGAIVTDFCRTYRHRLFRWPEHLQRLRHDCDRCRVPLLQSDAEITAVAEEVAAACARQLANTEEFALITVATPGPLAYLSGAASDGPPTLAIQPIRLNPDRYRRFFLEGVTLAVAGLWPRHPAEIVPRTVKHRSRLHWWVAEQSLRSPEHPLFGTGAVPVLLDQEDACPDTPIGSVLAVASGQVIVPIPGTVLESISTRVVIEISRAQGFAVIEQTLNLESLVSGKIPGVGEISELLLTGSGFGIAGVRRLLHADRECRFRWPGPVFLQLFDAWSNEVGVRLDEWAATHPKSTG